MHILFQMNGTYLLIMELHTDASILIGKHGILSFKKGCYAYIGSALNGLEQRIQRHRRIHKKTHWHIDYLRPHIKIIDIFYKENTIKEECTIAQAFEKHFENIPGFGCTDCSCESHLFSGSCRKLTSLARSLQMNPYPLEANS